MNAWALGDLTLVFGFPGYPGPGSEGASWTRPNFGW